MPLPAACLRMRAAQEQGAAALARSIPHSGITMQARTPKQHKDWSKREGFRALRDLPELPSLR